MLFEKTIAMLPAIVPTLMFLMYKGYHRTIPFTTEEFDREYDYIVGKHLTETITIFYLNIIPILFFLLYII